MGVIVSYFSGSTESNEPDAITGLTPKEVAWVQNSWTPIKKDLLGTGVELFMIFFKKFPEYQNHFPFRNIPYEELRTSEKLHAHGINVMYALSAILDNLNNPKVLVNLLASSAKSHARRKIPEKAFWDLKISIMELLHQAMGAKLTQEGADAWDKTLTVALGVIIKEISKIAPNE